MLGILLIVVGIFGIYVLLATQTDLLSRLTEGTTAPREVLLEAKASAGPDPFTAPVDDLVVDPVVAPPAGSGDIAGVAVSLDGSSVGLYGGTNNDQLCDQAQMIAFLEQDTAKRDVWAGVQGIAPGDVSSYVAALTPAILNVDTRVTNHGFKNGQATPRQSVLQAGTAVLVDAKGTPRARCRCGNPLLPPEPATGPVTYAGQPWDGFDETRLVAPPGTPAAPAGGPSVAGPTSPELSTTSGQVVAEPTGESVLVDGGFDEALAAPWGTGIYEPREQLFWGQADAEAVIDTDVFLRGTASLRITNRSPQQPQVYRTLSQRVAVDPSQPHCLAVWTLTSSDAQPGVLTIALNDAWTMRLTVPLGGTDWALHEISFTPEDGDIDVRLISENVGTIWVDGLVLVPGACPT